MVSNGVMVITEVMTKTDTKHENEYADGDGINGGRCRPRHCASTEITEEYVDGNCENDDERRSRNNE